MTFSNPAGDAARAAPVYVRALLDLLGSREPLEVLEELVPWARARTAALGDDLLRRPERPGKWSVIEVLQHLADTEIVVGFRIRMALSEERPALRGFDQDRWAALFRYREAELETTLAQLAGVRVGNLRVWRSLGPAERERVGMHSERGPESVQLMLRMSAAHDLVHRRQIDRILAAAGRSER
jgi:hypothetical protein